MRFMMILKASKETEAGVMPEEKLIAAMTKYNEELAKAGVLRDLAGLYSTAKGARIKYAAGKPSVVRGPFPATPDLMAGYWVIDVKSLEEAIDWARRAPAPHGDGKDAEIELRQFLELEDFGESPSTDRARDVEKSLSKKT
jgi:hypothetical protein